MMKWRVIHGLDLSRMWTGKGPTEAYDKKTMLIL